MPTFAATAATKRSKRRKQLRAQIAETHNRKEKTMTKTERQDLLQICRQRERVAKGEAVAVAAQHKATFAAQLARVYHFDEDAVWQEATRVAKEAARHAQEQVAARCQRLSIPRWAQPELSEPHWYGRGENAVAQRRAELTKVAHAQIDQHLKETIHAIQRASVEIQTQLVADGLTSADAKAFLESMPSPAQLMPVVTVEEIQKQLAGEGGGNDDAEEE
jgi:hypothetical protein